MLKLAYIILDLPFFQMWTNVLVHLVRTAAAA